jgi:RNA polymerase sigma factor (sigma-70 family)
MIDFVENYYNDFDIDNHCDEEIAKRKAFSAVLPLIIQNELTQKQSICLKYHYINGKSQAEIAKMLKLSQPTVSRHISAAKEIVNNKLKYCYIALTKGFDEYENG